MRNIKIFVEHKTYQRMSGKWVLSEDYGIEEISEKVYYNLSHDTWRGDRRTYGSTPFAYRGMRKLTNTERDLGLKSVRVFTFKEEGK